MRHDHVRCGVGLDPQRRIGEQAYFRGRRLLHFAVGAAVDIVLPHRQVALLRQRMRNRARIRPAECLELVGGEPDDDFVLDGDDLEQISLGLLGPRGPARCPG
jgi:hypothetical protein